MFKANGKEVHAETTATPEDRAGGSCVYDQSRQISETLSQNFKTIKTRQH